MSGLSTKGSISLGCALVAGRKRVPRPAAGNTALRTLEAITFTVCLQAGVNRNWQKDKRVGPPSITRDLGVYYRSSGNRSREPEEIDAAGPSQPARDGLGGNPWCTRREL